MRYGCKQHTDQSSMLHVRARERQKQPETQLYLQKCGENRIVEMEQTDRQAKSDAQHRKSEHELQRRRDSYTGREAQQGNQKKQSKVPKKQSESRDGEREPIDPRTHM